MTGATARSRALSSAIVPLLSVLVAAGATSAATLDGGIARTGTVHALTILARFADESDLGAEVPTWAKEIFVAQRPGSLTHFYDEMSRGQYALTGDVLPRWYASRRDAATYTRSEGGFGDFSREILEAVDADIDLGLYDNDGPDGEPNSGDDDGYVDFVFIVTRSAPQNFIVEAATGIAQLGLGVDYVGNDQARRGGTVRVRADGSQVGGTLQRGRSYAEAVGSMAHEYGHFLLLPDLYDLDYHVDAELGPIDDSGGIGYWGLMGHGNRGWDEAGGPNPFCAWSLGELGWLGVDNRQLEILDDDLEGAVFADVNAGGKVFMLPEPDGTTFFLVEHRSRQNSYYERNLPAEGLLIWRINPQRTGNDLEDAKLVDLVCADGLYRDAGFPLGSDRDPFSGSDNIDFWAHDEGYRAAFGGNLGDATDVFNGERFTDFWAASNPAASPGISVTSIRRSGGQMVADLKLRDHRRAGPIGGTVVWRDSIKVVGDVTVLPGGRLDVAAGTEVEVGADELAMGADLARVEFVIHGQLNTNVSGRAQTVFRSSAAKPRPGDWLGIRLGWAGSAFLRRTRIEYPRHGLIASDLNKPLTMECVEIFAAAEDGVRLEGVDAEVQLDEIRVDSAGGVGILVDGSAVTRIRRAELRDNGVAGLWRRNGFLELADSRLHGNGLAVDSGANLVLDRGVSGRVADNAFDGGVGIHCIETRELVIEDNILTNHRIGLVSTSARPQISGNQFNRNELALRIEGAVVPPRVELNIFQQSERLLDHTASRPLTAINNWWGQIDSTWIAARISGEVRWQPFLNFDPRVPLDFALGQNYPNPFNGTTLIDYQIGINNPIVAGLTRYTLEVRTPLSGLVRRLVDEMAAPGFYTAAWDGRNERGERVASGVYYVQLQIGPIVQLNKMLFIK